MPPNWRPQDDFYELGHVSYAGASATPSGFRAVKNVWHERARAHLSHYRRFYSIIAVLAVCAIIAFTLLGVLLPRLKSGGPGGHASSDDPSSTPSMTTTQPSTTDVATASPTSTGASSSPSSPPAGGSFSCDPATFTSHVNMVAVYDPSVPAQFKIVPAHDAASCCRACSALSPQHCDGWGWIGSLCNVVYDYPGEGADAACPKGYPKVAVQTGGDEGNFGGKGPCASKDGG